MLTCFLDISRSIHDVKATDMGADTVRFKAEVNFDGREVARIHVNKLDLDKVMKVWRPTHVPDCHPIPPPFLSIACSMLNCQMRDCIFVHLILSGHDKEK